MIIFKTSKSITIFHTVHFFYASVNSPVAFNRAARFIVIEGRNYFMHNLSELYGCVISTKCFSI